MFDSIYNDSKNWLDICINKVEDKFEKGINKNFNYLGALNEADHQDDEWILNRDQYQDEFKNMPLEEKFMIALMYKREQQQKVYKIAK